MFKDKVYQLTIGVLVVGLGFTTYKLYSVNSSSEMQSVAKGEEKRVNVRELKHYQSKVSYPNSYQTNFDRLKLRQDVKDKLQQVDQKYKEQLDRSVELIEDYNQKNPNTPIVIPRDTLYDTKDYSAYSDKYISNPVDINKVLDDKRDETSNNIVGSSGYVSYQNYQSISSSTSSITDTTANVVSQNTNSGESVSSSSSVYSAKAQQYTQSIDEIKQMMQQINSKL